MLQKSKLIGCFLYAVGLTAIPCYAFSQNKYTVHIDQPDPLTPPILVNVGMNEENKNVVVWEADSNITIDYYTIYRTELERVEKWIPMGIVNNREPLVYVDQKSYPIIKSYAYSISATDLCNNETIQCKPVKTIKVICLTTDKSRDSLSWTPFEGTDVQAYNIYQGTQIDSMNLVATVQPFIYQYVPIKSSGQVQFYQIEAILSSNDNKAEKKLKNLSNRVKTNEINSKFDTLRREKLVVFPNPFKDQTIICFPNYDNENYLLTLWNLQGDKTLEQTITTNEFELSRGILQKGIYLLRLTGKNHYYCKVIIE